MPKYDYKCMMCGTKKTEMKSAALRKEGPRCRCGAGKMELQLPKIAEPTIMETKDKFRNVKQRKDQDQRVRDRAKKYFKEHEMEDLIAKHGEEKARQMGWITKDGKKNK